MSKKMSIAIDMDDVLANTTEKIVEAYNNKHAGGYVPDDLLNLDKEHFYTKEIAQFVYSELNRPGFARDLTVKENAIDTVKELGERYDIYIATAAMEIPGTFQDKYNWLEEHFPFLDSNFFIFCGNKKVVQADFLIDDSVQQLENFTGTGILYTAVMNQNLNIPFTRKNNWMEIREHFVDSYKGRLSEIVEK